VQIDSLHVNGNYVYLSL